MSQNTSSRDDVVILAGARTPNGRLNGQLAAFSAVELGGKAIAAALERGGVAAEQVDAVIMGHVIQAGAGQNPARQASIAAGLGWNVPTVTINKVCLSGLAAITDAARLIRSGEARVVVAGGQESMTNGPHLLPGSRQGWTYGSMTALDATAHDGLTDAFDHESMGVSTERRNSELGIGSRSAGRSGCCVPPAGRGRCGERRLRRRDRRGQSAAAQGRRSGGGPRRGRPSADHGGKPGAVAPRFCQGRHHHGRELVPAVRRRRRRCGG